MNTLEQLKTACKKLLANAVMEFFELELVQ